MWDLGSFQDEDEREPDDAGPSSGEEERQQLSKYRKINELVIIIVLMKVSNDRWGDEGLPPIDVHSLVHSDYGVAKDPGTHVADDVKVCKLCMLHGVFKCTFLMFFLGKPSVKGRSGSQRTRQTVGSILTFGHELRDLSNMSYIFNELNHEQVMSVDFSPDGEEVVAGGQSGMVKVKISEPCYSDIVHSG